MTELRPTCACDPGKNAAYAWGETVQTDAPYGLFLRAVTEGQQPREKRSKASLITLGFNAGFRLASIRAESHYVMPVAAWKGRLFPGRANAAKIAFCNQLKTILPPDLRAFINTHKPLVQLDLLDAWGILQAFESLTDTQKEDYLYDPSKSRRKRRMAKRSAGKRTTAS